MGNENRRELLAAMANGGSAGVQAYQRYTSRVSAADEAAYQGIVGDMGANPAYREILSRYTDPYQRDAGTASANYGDQLGYEQIAAGAVRDDYGDQLNRARYESSMRNQIEDVGRNAQAARRQAERDARTAAGMTDLSLAEQEAIARGATGMLEERAVGRLGEQAGAADTVKEKAWQVADALDRAQQVKDFISQRSAGGAAVDVLEEWMGADRKDSSLTPLGDGYAEQMDYADVLAMMAETVNDRPQSGNGLFDVAMNLRAKGAAAGDAVPVLEGEQEMIRAGVYRQQFGEEALGALGYDPLMAAGFAEQWFNPTQAINATMAEQAAMNELLYGSPEGAAGASDAAAEQRQAEVDAMLAGVEDQYGLPAAAVRSAGEDALLSTPQVVDIVTSEAWADVDAKAREFADAGDPDGFIEWLEQNESLDRQAELLAVNLYESIFPS